MIDDFHLLAYYFLSNFYPVKIIYRGYPYESVEHGYAASKATTEFYRSLIADCPSPGEAKRLARQVPIRSDWLEVREGIMLDLLRLKFAPGSYLARKLRATRNHKIIEGNRWHDNFWGSCRCEKCGYRGRNRLGEMLMQVRKELRAKGDRV